ncbi:unnamed protein product [marine sediment metagenome]|uniref:Uncharacterized protein n=1 Tax=marine sediment metagenome TaxID=412755 RepID=X0V596_9ZZZZ
MKDLTRFGQNIASDEYQRAYQRDYGQFSDKYGRDLGQNREAYQRDVDAYNRFNIDRSNRFNRLGTVAGYGQTANTALAGQGLSTAQSVAGNVTQLGSAAGANELSRGGAMKDLWQMGAAAGGAYMACWVARAIFGESDPKWRQARHYILNIGPKWFKKLYLKHGEKFSLIVKKSVLLKCALRPVFEYFAWKGRFETGLNRGAVYAY